MASRFWVGGTGSWDAADTTHWAATSNGAGGQSVPGVADTVTLDASSGGGTVTVTAPVSVTSITAGAFTGTLDTNGQAVTTSGDFNISGAGTRSITLGASAISCGTWTATTTTGLTFSAASSTITHTGATTFNGGGLTYGTVLQTGTAPTIAGSPTFGAYTRTGTATKTDTLTLSGNLTITGLNTATGNSATNRLLIQSSVLGTPRSITAGSVSLSNCDFMDITGAGAAAPFTGTSLGDCLGNSGITFTPSVTQYWQTLTTGTKTWSTAGNWFLATNGGGGAGRVPLPQDDVVFDLNSIGATGTILSRDMPRSGRNVDFTGATNAPTMNHTAFSTAIYGSLTCLPTMTLGGGYNFEFRGRTPQTFTPPSTTLTLSIDIEAYGGKVTLMGAFVGDDKSLYITAGEIDTNGFSVLCGALSRANGSVAATLRLGATTATMSAGGVSLSGVTVIPGTSLLKFTSTTSSVKTFSGGGNTFNNVWFSGTGPFSIVGSNTFADYRVDPGLVVRHTAGTTQTVSTATLLGRAANATDAPYGLLDGAIPTFFTTPDSAALDITGDLSAVADLRLASYSSGINQDIMSRVVSVGQISYVCRVGATGFLALYWSADGTAYLSATSTATLQSVGIASGQRVWVGWNLDVDNGAAGRTIKFYYSTNLTTWTQLGASVVQAGVTGIFNSTSLLHIGFNPDTQTFPGKIYRARLYAGDAFTASPAAVVDFNPSLWTSGDTFTASTGEVWTRNGNAMFSADNLTTLQGVTAATWTLAKAGGGIISADRLALRNSTATPGSTWYAGSHSMDGGSNSGWGFFDTYDYGCVHIDALTSPTADLTLQTPTITLAMAEC